MTRRRLLLFGLLAGLLALAGFVAMDNEDARRSDIIRSLEIEIQDAECTITRPVARNPDGSEDKAAVLKRTNAENLKRARSAEISILRGKLPMNLFRYRLGL